MRKLLYVVFVFSLIMFISCSEDENPTGPSNPTNSSYVRDYHLIVSHGDSLLSSLPETLAIIDSAYCYNFFGYTDTVNLPHIEKGTPILKGDLGLGEEGNYQSVIVPGNKLFSISYPSQYYYEGNNEVIEIWVHCPDTILVFENNMIYTFFSPVYANSDTSVEHGVETEVWHSDMYGTEYYIRAGTGTGFVINN